MDLPVGAQWLDKLSVSCETILTIGVLDGVHRGHQHLLRHVAQRAREIAGCSAVITFRPHPQEVVAPDRKVAYLTPLQDRVRLIREQGIDIVSILGFTSEVARMAPDEFIDLVLDHIKLVELWIGPDFALGHRRAGSVKVLTEIGRARGFDVRVTPPFLLDGNLVSSTAIRKLLAEGQIKEAAVLLGRSYFLTGVVASGFQRGRAIGIPTANLEVGDKPLIPANGVYAVYVHFDGHLWPGVLSIGIRPTFDDGQHQTIEVHLLDFDGDLYGRPLRLEFVEKLRDEMRFASVDQLVKQIHDDIQQARAILAR